MSERWIVVEIGCIECGCDSALVAVCDSEAEAEALAAQMRKQYHWHQGGQNSFEAWRCPDGPWRSPDYPDRAEEVR